MTDEPNHDQRSPRKRLPQDESGSEKGKGTTQRKSSTKPTSSQKEPGDGSPREGRQPTSPTTILMILALFAIVAWLIGASFMPTAHSEVTYTYFLKLLNGVDYHGNPILNEKGEQVTNLVGKDEQGTEIRVPSNIVMVKRSGFILQAYCRVAPPAEPKPEAEKWRQPIGLNDKTLEQYIRVVLDTSDLRDSELNHLLAERGVRLINEKPADSGWYQTIFILSITVVMVVLMWIMIRRTQSQMFGGGGFLNSFSKSSAKKYEAGDTVITFADVAGADGVKSELEEIVDFLKSPEKYQRLGGNVPKGVLMNGSPGTGKTLLAKAVAGEADVPFYSVNGSEFIQMFVGVGASRVRDLFQNAKDTAPSIIFIDEIDAVGRQRGAGLGGGHDEREQTLNQILSEMDGFGGGDSVIVIAATNRPDVLDPALLRPGRFDRHITVNRPTREGRKAIFKVHVRKVPLGDDVDLGELASASAGMTGADIKNLVNEAALHAAREGFTTVNKRSFSYALDRIRMGPRREEILTPDNKEKTAYHEAGHTLASWLLPKANPVSKVTVIPRGRSLGQTFMSPSEDRLDYSRSEMEQLLVVMLAGRSAEKLIYNETSAGAQQDLEQATSLARRMVTAWGMSDRLGPVSFKLSDEDPFLGREMHQARQFSEHTLEVIDDEITKILRTASEQADVLLSDAKDKLELITRSLIAKEELDHQELVALIGPAAQTDRPFLFDQTTGEQTAGEKPSTDQVPPGQTPDTSADGNQETPNDDKLPVV